MLNLSKSIYLVVRGMTNPSHILPLIYLFLLTYCWAIFELHSNMRLIISFFFNWNNHVPLNETQTDRSKLKMLGQISRAAKSMFQDSKPPPQRRRYLHLLRCSAVRGGNFLLTFRDNPRSKIYYFWIWNRWFVLKVR
jgi:hypothetical protein